MTNKQAQNESRVSTVLGRKLGGELMGLRTAAGLTQGQAAQAITASTGKIAKMESGAVPMRDPDIRTLCETYGLRDPSVVGGLLELARVDRERRKAKGWWDDFPELGDMTEYISLEHAATSIRTWQLTYIPGLLQTPDYVRSLCQDEATDEQFVEARLTRQKRLDESPPLALDVMVHEAALRQLVGGTAVMRHQLDHLTSMASRDNITLRVLPFEAGALLGMNCAFNIMSFAELGAMDAVYMEMPFSRVWIEGGAQAVQHAELFEKIAQQALSERDSLQRIRDIHIEL